ncbi:unnamed protein product, partial [Closterium sp. Naga37s-1]
MCLRKGQRNLPFPVFPSLSPPLPRFILPHPFQRSTWRHTSRQTLTNLPSPTLLSHCSPIPPSPPPRFINLASHIPPDTASSTTRGAPFPPPLSVNPCPSFPSPNPPPSTPPSEINLASYIPPDTSSTTTTSSYPSAPLVNGSYRIHVKSVFVDPGGRHTLAVLQHTPLGAPSSAISTTGSSGSSGSGSGSGHGHGSGSGSGSGTGGAVAGMYAAGTYWDVVYVHGGWQRARHVARHRMAIGAVAAVAWQPAPMAHDGSTREIILATEGGRLYEASFEEADKRDRPLKLLFELPDAEKCPFRGIQMEVLGLHGGGSSGGGFSGGVGGGAAGGGTTASGASSQRFFVLAATATRLLAFVGSTTLEATFAPFASQLPKFIELPASSPLIPSSLHFFGRQQRYAERFAWMAGPGVLFGHLNLNATSSSLPCGSSSEPPIQRKSLLPFAKLLPPSHVSSADDTDDSSGAAAASAAAVVHPTAMAVSEFHLLLLYSDHIKIVNQVSEALVDQLPFHATSLEMAPGGMLGLVADEVASAYYAFCSNNIYEIAVCDEGRAMWQVYLDRHDYAMALSFCRTPLQRDRVYAAQADSAFKGGDYERAATFFARTAHQVPFEEVALKFVEAGQQDALRSFLLHKLDHLPKQERAQMTMVATWASELYLDKINQLLLQLPPDFEKQESLPTKSESGVERLREEYGRVVAAFRAFLSDCKDVLNEATTVKLLASYGREEELVYFAGLKQRHETVIEHFIRQGDADSAIAVLRRPSVPLELLCKFALLLLMSFPFCSPPAPLLPIPPPVLRQHKFSPALVLLAPSNTVDLWIMPASAAAACVSSASAAVSTASHIPPCPRSPLSPPPVLLQYKFSPALVLLAPSNPVDLWIMPAPAAAACVSSASAAVSTASHIPPCPRSPLSPPPVLPQYKFSPALVLLAPSNTVDLWIMPAPAASTHPPLFSSLPFFPFMPPTP